MSNWRLAESLKRLRAQINAEFPARDKSSDGSIGDPSHSARKSDHNPNSKGVVTAIDIDEDLNGDRTLVQVINAIRSSRDPRVKYIIYEGLITVPGSQLQQWKKYKGPSAHRHHAHISVNSDPKLYDDTKAWQISTAPSSQIPALHNSESTTGGNPSEQTAPSKLLKRGSKGAEVKALQTALNVRGYKLKVDGDFGPSTERAVRSFQNTKGLRPDGIAGKVTLNELAGF